MKKAIFILTVMLISASTFSFKKADQENWSRWSSFSNYPGLDYRVSRYEYNDYAKKWLWHFQFRNRYETAVTFRYGYSNLSSNCKTYPTIFNLAPGKESSVAGDLSDASTNISVCVDNLKFGK